MLVIAAVRFWVNSGRFAEGGAWAEQAMAMREKTPNPLTQGLLRLAAGWVTL
jgi:hypothetical protein